MKLYKAICFQMWMLVFLLAACSQEDFVPEENGGSSAEQSMPITIRLQTRASGSDTEIDQMYNAIDKVRIMVFRCTKAEYENSTLKKDAPFTYVSGCISPDETVDCKPESEGQWRSAKATFKPLEDENKTAYVYRIYAVAYSSADADKITFNTGSSVKLYYDNDLTATGGEVSASGYAYVTVKPNEEGIYEKVMFFAGPVGYSEEEYKKEGSGITDDEFTDDLLFSDAIKEDVPLTGYLYRATGAMTITLTDIDEEYTKLRLVMEKYTNNSLMGIGLNWAMWRDDQKNKNGVLYTDYQPGKPAETSDDASTYPTFSDVFINHGVTVIEGEDGKGEEIPKFSWDTRSMVTVCEKEVENKRVVLNVSCLGVDKFKLYVLPIKEGSSNNSNYRQILCKDKEYYPGFIGIKDHIVKDGEFTLRSNYRLKLLGAFKNIGNIWMETDWEDDYQFDTPLQPVTGN